MLHVHIQEDLILLENQLPFFILEELHEIFINGQSENSSFFDVACKYFSSYIKKIEKKEVKHFTDLIRYSYCPIKHNSFGGGISDLCTAKKLSEAGVIFKLDKKGDALDIEFLKSPATEICPCFTCSWLLNCLPCLKRPLLKIPRFEINDGTESLLWHWSNAIIQGKLTYAILWCYWIILPKLEKMWICSLKKKIIVNEIGSNKAVAIMVNKLSLEIVEENSCYTDLAEELKNHYAQCCNHNMGYLRSNYFSNLWRGTVTVVGLIVLGFTFWSTIRPDVTHQIESVHCV